MITAQIVEIRLAGEPDAVRQLLAREQLARRFGLDGLPPRRKLFCHWHCDQEGRLAGIWEARIGLVPQL